MHFLVILYPGRKKHLPYKLFLNLSGGNPEGGGAVGDIVIMANECFFARLSHTQIDAINVEADGSDNIQVQVFAIIDDGGV